MSQRPEDKKMDISNLPRGAIGIKGLPVSRNTRLPSIRSPRDLTLSTQPKRTYMPNIPVRREKKPQVSENASQIKQESVIKLEKKNDFPVNDRGRGRGRGKPNIIQTQGSIFSEGISGNALSRKERMRDAKSDFTSPRGISIKKEKDDKDVAGVSKRMNLLLRDDFIDDGDEDDDFLVKPPVTFPVPAAVKKEAAKCEVKKPTADFDPNIAKEMGFDVNRVAKFIKKEKGTEVKEDKDFSVLTEIPEIPSNEITNILHTDTNSSKLVLLKLPEFLYETQKVDDSDLSNRRTSADPKSSNNQTTSLSSLKCLPEGYVGKLQVMKSGKVRLVVGSVEYTLDSVNSLRDSEHEVVSITTNSNSGNVCVLGCVGEMLKFVPNEDSLLS